MTMFCKTSLVFLVVILLSDSLDGQGDKKFYRVDYTYIEALESFYKINTTLTTWFDAKQMCAHEGASLYYPKNVDEAHAVGLFLNNTYPGEDILIGMSDLLALGLYETIDGKSLSEVYHTWSQDEPLNFRGTLHCIFMKPNNLLYVNNCTSDKAFICKKSQQWNYRCDMFDLDYTFNNNTGDCYKLHTTPLSWSDAYAACRAEQSYLAVINNQLEADYLVNFMEPASKLRAKGNYFRGIFHVGFHDRTHDGWHTVKGTPMNIDTNDWWGYNQPEGHDQCGSLFYNGRLGNVNCDTKSFFICKHEVASETLLS